MSEEAAFVAALAANPTDKTAALVFADWLDDRGDPRGPMLRDDEVRAWRGVVTYLLRRSEFLYE